jgi:beta-lactamase superfamily II metal-dependent hydrolase
MSLEQVKAQGYGFATYPFVRLYNYCTKENKKEKKNVEKWSYVKQLLFGDYIKVILKNGEFEKVVEDEKTFIKVHCRNEDGYIPEDGIQAARILEINFVDVGQGDGCHIVTPTDEHFIIDAGVSDNMFRFLKWRFNLKTSKVAPPALKVIISHPDSDHFKGFLKLFTPDKGLSQQLKFDSVYHNGIFEMGDREENDKLGKKIKSGNYEYIEELFETDEQAKNHLNKVKKESLYEKTLKAALDNHRKVKFQALWREDGQAFYKKENLEIEVLGPVTELIENKKMLRYFKGSGPTKNGHSVILMFKIGNAKIFIGGDLNKVSEEYLLEKFTGTDVTGINNQLKKEKDKLKIEELNKQLDDAVLKARKYFQSDAAKSCHHGSHDFSKDFLRAINAVATVISSGDDESYCHPRPDSLGTIGKFSRGERPMIFSTELARSNKEFIDLKDIPEGKKRERVVTVYGMINLRTDGEKMIIAQKLERKAATRNWDIHNLEWDKTTGIFEYKFEEKE